MAQQYARKIREIFNQVITYSFETKGLSISSLAMHSDRKVATIVFKGTHKRDLENFYTFCVGREFHTKGILYIRSKEIYDDMGRQVMKCTLHYTREIRTHQWRGKTTGIGSWINARTVAGALCCMFFTFGVIAFILLFFIILWKFF